MLEEYAWLLKMIRRKALWIKWLSVENGIEKALNIPQNELCLPKTKSTDDALTYISTYNPIVISMNARDLWEWILKN